MFGMIKIAGLSAVLSAGLVSAYNPAPAADGKLYQDRVAQSEEVVAPLVRTAAYSPDERGRGASAGCSAQAWPNIAPECLRGTEGAPVRAVRTITIERRDGENTSTLVRLPADAARR